MRLLFRRVLNETREEREGVLRVFLRDSDFNTVFQTALKVSAPAMSSTAVFEKDLTELLAGHEDSLFFGFQLLEDGEEIACDSHLFVPEKSFALEDPEIEWNVIREEEGLRISLSAKKFARSVELSLEGMDGVFSDNYFDLCDEHEKTVFLPFEDITLQMGDITTGPVLRGITPDEITDRRLEKALRIRSLYDTYDHF